MVLPEAHLAIWVPRYMSKQSKSISCCEIHRILILKQKEFRKTAPARSLHQFVGWLCLKSFDCLSPHNLDLMYDNNRQGNRWSRNEVKRSLDLRQKLTHSRSSQVWCDPKKALVNSGHFEDKLVAWFARIFSESLTFLALREPPKVFHEFLAGMGNANHPTVNCNQKRQVWSASLPMTFRAAFKR